MKEIIPIVVQDKHGSETYTHFLATPPKRLTVRSECRAEIAVALEKAQEANPDEWTYEDVGRYLKGLGWVITEVDTWVE